MLYTIGDVLISLGHVLRLFEICLEKSEILLYTFLHQMLYAVDLILNLDVPHIVLDRPLELQPSPTTPPVVTLDDRETRLPEALRSEVNVLRPAPVHALHVRASVARHD